MNPCTVNSTYCKTPAQINKYFKGKRIQFMYADYTFDAKDQDNMVKRYVNEKLFFTLSD